MGSHIATIATISLLLTADHQQLDRAWSESIAGTNRAGASLTDALTRINRNAREMGVNVNTAMREGQRVFAATRTEAEKYGQSIAKLDELLKIGVVSQETYDRAVEKLKDAQGEGGDVTEKLTDMLGELGTAAGLAFTAAGLAFTADGVIEGIKERAKQIDDLKSAADGLGISFQSLQEYQNVAFVKGNIDAEAFTTLLEKMNKDIGDAEQRGGELAKTFAQMGINLNGLKNSGADQQFRTIIESLSQIEDKNLRASDGAAIFGRSYAQLLPIIDGGTEAMDRQIAKAHELGEILSDKDAAAFQQDAEAIRQASEAAQGFEASLVRLLNLSAVLGSLTDALNALRKGISGDDDAGERGAKLADQASILHSLISADETLIAYDNKHNGALAERIKYEGQLVAHLTERIGVEKQMQQLAENRLAGDKPGSKAEKQDQSDVSSFDKSIAGLQSRLTDAQTALDGLSDQQAEAAKAAKLAGEAAKKEGEEFDAALKHLTEAAETPAQKLLKDIGILNRGLAEHKITWQEWGAAVKKAIEEAAAPSADKFFANLKKQQEQAAEDAKRWADRIAELHKQLETPEEKKADLLKDLEDLKKHGLSDQDYQRELAAINGQNTPTNQNDALAKGLQRSFDFYVPSAVSGAHKDAAKETKELHDTQKHALTHLENIDHHLGVQSSRHDPTQPGAYDTRNS